MFVYGKLKLLMAELHSICNCQQYVVGLYRKRITTTEQWHLLKQFANHQQ